eukprot:scaffold79865_cov38-Phaeocystis_antarctica.AAC.4
MDRSIDRDSEVRAAGLSGWSHGTTYTTAPRRRRPTALRSSRPQSSRRCRRLPCRAPPRPSRR